MYYVYLCTFNSLKNKYNFFSNNHFSFSSALHDYKFSYNSAKYEVLNVLVYITEYQTHVAIKNIF